MLHIWKRDLNVSECWSMTWSQILRYVYQATFLLIPFTCICETFFNCWYNYVEDASCAWMITRSKFSMHNRQCTLKRKVRTSLFILFEMYVNINFLCCNSWILHLSFNGQFWYLQRTRDLDTVGVLDHLPPLQQLLFRLLACQVTSYLLTTIFIISPNPVVMWFSWHVKYELLQFCSHKGHHHIML